MAEEKIIVFSLNGETYGAPVNQVVSIEKLQVITRVPNAKPFIKGVMNLRGMILPVVDLLQKFEIGQSDIVEATRLAIVESEDVQVALIIDSARDVVSIDGESIEPVPEIAGGVHAKYLKGVAKHEEDLLVLLNLDLILNPDDIEAIKQLEV
ncbi:purine-binding chemotaxis protein CheW [Pullulanibacillus pueri]|uniref:Chemotaxis protein CheW n=1 Tax=Pullulanibacillus pueri TaxID=1437324 RepID=A0A8J2ZVR4_9BACL|nr:chemotaxis protein CheW [Pullulanibacillus pueri]MBM7682499.1 purine-binding chemotaxis protein CheW [Pullulanibacillus pueri]GGH82154.1 chemotaxis protein CheW [Pullulanibacillus pueri]